MAAENPVVFAEIGNPKRVTQLTENTSTTNAYFLTEKAGEPEAKKTAYSTVESAVKAKIQGEYLKTLSPTPSDTKTMSEKLEVAEFKKRDDKIVQLEQKESLAMPSDLFISASRGYINVNGDVDPIDGCMVTGFIPIVERIYITTKGTTSLYPVFLYDGAKKPLVGAGLPSAALKTQEVRLDNVNNNAVYFRVWSADDISYSALNTSLQPTTKTRIIDNALIGDFCLIPEIISDGYIDFDGSFITSASYKCTQNINTEVRKKWKIITATGASRQPIAAYNQSGSFLRFYGAKSSEIMTETIYLDADVDSIRYWGLKSNISIKEVTSVESIREQIIVSATVQGANYTTMEALFNNEPAGEKDIHLPDKLYIMNNISKKYDFLEGWRVKGNGMDNTVIQITCSATHALNLLDVVGSCSIEDLTIKNLYPQTQQDNVGYALHIDLNVDNLDFIGKNLKLQCVSNGNTQPNGLVLGIGTWNNQRLVFEDCVFETINELTNGAKGILNFHNNNHSGLPSKTIFKNCIFGNGTSSIAISETAASIPLETRGKDDILLLGCEVRSYIALLRNFGSNNGYNMNWSGTKFYGITRCSNVNPNLDSYTELSLPLCDQVEFMLNTGQESIAANTFVEVVTSMESVMWGEESSMKFPVKQGVKKYNQGKVYGVSLVVIASGKKGHILREGATEVSANFDTGLVEGDYLRYTGLRVVKADTVTNMIYKGSNVIQFVKN